MVVLTLSFCVSSFFVVLFAFVATLASVKSFVGVAVANLSTSATPPLTIEVAFKIGLLLATLI